MAGRLGDRPGRGAPGGGGDGEIPRRGCGAPDRRRAADLFGAASVLPQHPIHRFPLDAWAAALGEGTQDIQKQIIFREALERRGGS